MRRFIDPLAIFHFVTAEWVKDVAEEIGGIPYDIKDVHYNVIANLILPGALVQLLVGVRTSMAYGWRALVASEMIAGSSGLGYMTMEAVQWQRTDVIILGMIVIGLIWVAMDRLVFTAIERRTVARWGLLQR